MPSANKTANLGLNQWLGNEYPKRTDFVEDNKKIDDAFGELDSTIKNIDLSSTKVIRPNKKTVEESLSANETSILNNGKLAQSALDKANEAFQFASNGKQLIATAITGKGISASGNDTFSILAEKIDGITVSSLGGKRWAMGNSILNDVKISLVGKAHNAYTTDVSNLNFVPETIICKTVDRVYSDRFSYFIYTKLNDDKIHMVQAQNSIEQYTYFDIIPSSNENINLIFRSNGILRLPCVSLVNYRQMDCYWIAFG